MATMLAADAVDSFLQQGDTMSDTMVPIPFRVLLKRAVQEFAKDSSIFGIHADRFYRSAPEPSAAVFTRRLASPVGPAAGPHTQLAQNIITAYLCGARYIELKTVQILDSLAIDKPCIYAGDEAYNVEWSTELSLEQAFDEYLKAWIMVHVAEALFPSGPQGESDFRFEFNMSVGYDLQGIRTPRMQTFIDSMMDASETQQMKEYLGILREAAEDEEFLADTPLQSRRDALRKLAEAIPGTVCPSVTLSTMHGCPPDEIEAICSYLLTEKHIDTFVKLNPTLLSYTTVRDLLDRLGYEYISLKPETFSHDLQFSDAFAMIGRLQNLAAAQGRGFGVKLSNTLGTVNDQGILPGNEMYMSGRALFPLTVRLAARLSAEFEGRLAVSFCGGVQARSVKQIVESGIRPVTAATDLLKPGGFYRMLAMAEACRDISAEVLNRETIDTAALEALADEAAADPLYKKEGRGYGSVTVHAPLPLTDCYIAPCVQACPIRQDVPEYIHLAGEGRYAEALALIYEKNPLPNITGWICDHQCMYACTRIDYEGAVDIREVKRIAAELGEAEYRSQIWEKPEHAPVKAAVIGAGPAGLSAAFFLARAGFTVTLFEREQSAGGIIRNSIPAYRLPLRAVEADIEHIEAQGVEIVYGVDPQRIAMQTLKDEGYVYLFYAVGADIDNKLELEGADSRVIAALGFLRQHRSDPSSVKLGSSVVVVGGGNTAMDGARSAKSVAGVKEVTVVYRRTREQMPADIEEFEHAVEDGVKFIYLAAPQRLDPSGELTCRNMRLGEPDESGRRRPVPTEETMSIHADTVITAVGERVDTSLLEQIGIPLQDGRAEVDEQTCETNIPGVYLIGDAESGPSTVVRCIAAARRAVEAAVDREIGPEEEEAQLEEYFFHEHEHDHDHEKEPDESALEAAEDAFFAEIRAKKTGFMEPAVKGEPDARFAAVESARCLECSYICNKCVDVCPNRANVAVDVRPLMMFDNPFQIVHIDALCNECGNCAVFCPWEGKPYTDKLTIFNSRACLEESSNPGFALSGDGVTLFCRSESGGEVTEVPYLDGIPEGLMPGETAELIELILNHYPYLTGLEPQS